MRTPIFNRQHVVEYFLYGLLAAVLYSATLVYYMMHNQYENSYYLYIGNGLFFLSIFYYNVKLLSRPYDKNRAVSMLIAGNLATVAGVILSVIIAWIVLFGFFPDAFSTYPKEEILSNAPATDKLTRPTDLLFMIFINSVFCNFGAGALISVMISYAGKRNQTKDKPAHLDPNIHKA